MRGRGRPVDRGPPGGPPGETRGGRAVSSFATACGRNLRGTVQGGVVRVRPTGGIASTWRRANESSRSTRGRIADAIRHVTEIINDVVRQSLGLFEGRHRRAAVEVTSFNDFATIPAAPSPVVALPRARTYVYTVNTVNTVNTVDRRNTVCRPASGGGGGEFVGRSSRARGAIVHPPPSLARSLARTSSPPEVNAPPPAMAICLPS